MLGWLKSLEFITEARVWIMNIKKKYPNIQAVPGNMISFPINGLLPSRSDSKKRLSDSCDGRHDKCSSKSPVFRAVLAFILVSELQCSLTRTRSYLVLQFIDLNPNLPQPFLLSLMILVHCLTIRICLRVPKFPR
jgi:hypothetical protein